MDLNLYPLRMYCALLESEGLLAAPVPGGQELDRTVELVSCDSRELPDCLQHPFRQLPAGCSVIYGKSALQGLTHIQSSCFCSSLDRKTNQKQYSNYQQE